MKNRFILTPFFLDAPAAALERLLQPGWTLNCPALLHGAADVRMSAIHEALAGQVAADLRAGARPVSMAGDCCTAIGVVAGLQRAGLRPVLVWLDAHGDFNTPETTISGFIGGMPLAMIVGRGDQALPQAVGMHSIAEADVFLADARDLDPGERQLLERSRVHRVTDLETLPDRVPTGRPLYVHFDVDVLNKDEAPAMRYAVAGGPSLGAAQRMAARLAANGQLAAVSLTVWDMEADRTRQTERACLSTLGHLVGDPKLGT